MKSSTLLEQIYYGEFSPGGQRPSRDPAYLDACKVVDQGVRFFSGVLTGEEKRRFDQLVRAMQDMSGMDAYWNFACGFRSGARLMRELDEKPKPFGG